MTNYTVPENQKAPFTFEAESINPTVSEEGQFKILGTVNQDTEEDIEFTLELIYPAGYMTKCTLHKVLVDQVEVTCVLDEPWLCRNWTSSNKRWIELFIFTEICSDEILHGGEETSTEEEEETVLLYRNFMGRHILAVLSIILWTYAFVQSQQHSLLDNLLKSQYLKKRLRL